MRTADSLEALRQHRGPWHLAIGVFDGLHLGHQAVIKAALERRDWAQQEAQWLNHVQGEPAPLRAATAVITFEPHPMAILRPDAAPLRLCSAQEQASLLEALSVDLLITLPFTPAFAQQSAFDFAQQLQAAAPQLQSLSVGEDWRFGHKAQGNVDLLLSLGIPVLPLAPIIDDGLPISSTRVREALSQGDFQTAKRLLGRPWSLTGTVVQGQQLGRQLACPTANLAVSARLPIQHGVSIISVQSDAHPDLHAPRRGVGNYGRRPTVMADGYLLFEAHVLDWNGDLYGKDITITWEKFLRPERRFPHVDALRDQIWTDMDMARDWTGD